MLEPNPHRLVSGFKALARDVDVPRALALFGDRVRVVRNYRLDVADQARSHHAAFYQSGTRSLNQTATELPDW